MELRNTVVSVLLAGSAYLAATSHTATEIADVLSRDSSRNDVAAASDIVVGGEITAKRDLEVMGQIKGPGSIAFKSYSFSGDRGTDRVYYMAGFYDVSGTEAALTDTSPTQTYGIANHAYGAHALAVAKQAGTTDGFNLLLIVTGTSITDLGVKTEFDSEIIVLDATAAATGDYYETALKWLGQITYTLSSTGGTAFDFNFNYGFVKYEDFGNRDHTVTDIECKYHMGANESDLGIRFLHHSDAGWTYSAADFIPGGSSIVASMAADYGTNVAMNLNGKGSYKRAGLTHAMAGADAEGVIIEVSFNSSNAVRTMDCHIGATF